MTIGDASMDALQLLPVAGAVSGIDILPGIAVSDLRYSAMLQQCTRAAGGNPFTAPNVVSGCVLPAVQAQLADAARPWSTQQALGAIVDALTAGGTPLQITRLTAVTNDAATFQLSGTYAGQTFSDEGFITVDHLTNPLLDQPGGQPGTTSIALVGLCAATPDAASAVDPLCAQVLGSFSPGSTFWDNVAQAAMQRYTQEFQLLLQIGSTSAAGFAQRSQLIARWGASMQQIQTSTFQALQSQRLQAGQQAIATLGGNVLVQDATTGNVYSVPDGYRAYCLNAAGNGVVAGRDVVPGVTGCATPLAPVR